MADLKFEKDLYYKELSQYFAFAVADMFRSPVYLMMDGDTFVHAFVEVLPGYFLDAKGFFQNIEERSEFKYTDVNSFYLKEAQEFLKKLMIARYNIFIRQHASNSKHNS